MILPTIIDYGTDQDAGFWLACRPFVHFPWIDFEPVHEGVDRLSDSDGPAGSAGQSKVMLDPEDSHILSEYYCYLTYTKTTAYVVARRKSDGSCRRLGRLLLKPGPGFVVDHINGNPLDNRRRNLRCVTPQANNHNRAKRKGTSSRFKGVSRKKGRWFACLYENYRQIALGLFDTEAEAARAYDAAARERFGECAALNFPKAGEQSAHRQRTITYHDHTNSAREAHDHA